MRAAALFVAVLGGAALVACPAEAHAPVKGLGDFYSGMLHPLRVPSHALTLVAVALLVGQGGADRFRLVGVAFLAGLALGLVLGGIGITPPGLETFLLALAGVAGLCVAAAWQPPQLIRAALAGLAALAIGIDSLPESLATRGSIVLVAGTVASVLFLPLLVAGATIEPRRRWQEIGVRVVASWTAAAALMVLALIWAGPKSLEYRASPAGTPPSTGPAAHRSGVQVDERRVAANAAQSQIPAEPGEPGRRHAVDLEVDRAAGEVE